MVSNDALYGHDPKFLVEVNNLCAQVVDSILMQLKSLGAAHQQRTQAQLAMELFMRIVRYADLEREPLCQLAVKLWLLANKAQAQLDSETIVRIQQPFDIKVSVIIFVSCLAATNAVQRGAFL